VRFLFSVARRNQKERKKKECRRLIDPVEREETVPRDLCYLRRKGKKKGEESTHRTRSGKKKKERTRPRRSPPSKKKRKNTVARPKEVNALNLLRHSISAAPGKRKRKTFCRGEEGSGGSPGSPEKKEKKGVVRKIKKKKGGNLIVFLYWGEKKGGVPFIQKEKVPQAAQPVLLVSSNR